MFLDYPDQKLLLQRNISSPSRPRDREGNIPSNCLFLFLFVSVIAFASGEDLQQLTYLGIMGLLDPPRPGVREAIRTLMESGVEVKMVTGDAKETALTIGKKSCCAVACVADGPRRFG